jgi:hypothetical protein
MGRNVFPSGWIISLSAHLLLAFLVVPVIKYPSYVFPKSQTVYLGSILKESDLLPFSGFSSREERIVFLKDKDLARGVFSKKMGGALHKPKTPLVEKAYNPMVVLPAQPRVSPSQANKEISFGFSDFSAYIDHAEMDDLKAAASREELFSHAIFTIQLTPRGEVRSIRKVAGSGDPVFDLAIMLKLKTAVFKPSLIPADGWLNLRFKIK